MIKVLADNSTFYDITLSWFGYKNIRLNQRELDVCFREKVVIYVKELQINDELNYIS